MNYSILIPTYNNEKMLDRTLSSIGKSLIPDSISAIYVVENGGKFNSEYIVNKYSNILPVKYLYSDIANKSSALNFALSVIDSDVVIFFDDDIRIEHETISSYVEAVEMEEQCCFWGGPLLVDYEQPPLPYIRRYLPRSARGWALKEGEKPDWFLGANWAVRVEHLHKVGGFDVAFGPGSKMATRGQETEMQRRLMSNGIFPKYIPSAVVYHYVPRANSSLEWLLIRKAQDGRGKGLRVIKENEGVPLFALMVVFLKFLILYFLRMFPVISRWSVFFRLRYIYNFSVLKVFIGYFLSRNFQVRH